VGDGRAPRGDAYPSERLEAAWKTLAAAPVPRHPPGSGIHWVYDDAARDHAEVLATAEQVVADATRAVVAEVDTDATNVPS